MGFSSFVISVEAFFRDHIGLGKSLLQLPLQGGQGT